MVGMDMGCQRVCFCALWLHNCKVLSILIFLYLLGYTTSTFKKWVCSLHLKFATIISGPLQTNYHRNRSDLGIHQFHSPSPCLATISLRKLHPSSPFYRYGMYWNYWNYCTVALPHPWFLSQITNSMRMPSPSSPPILTLSLLGWNL